MPVLGMLGTIVRDRIHLPPRDGDAAADDEAGPDGADSEGLRPMEDWGGIVYALEAFEAAREESWTYLPIVKVGSDVYDEAVPRIEILGGVRSLAGLRRVPEPNNRVELHYRDRGDRCERLSGGVPGWRWPELEPLVAECDAVYVNFIAGWELDLAAARELRRGFGGPIYCDIHSLLLGVDTSGVRVRRALPDWDEWAECFDFLQGNRAEIATVSGRDDPLDGVRRLAERGAEAAFCTLGAEGAAWASADGRSGVVRPEDAGATADGAPPPAAAVDPTGCGDVWGAACLATLVAGRSVPDAVNRANRFGAVAARHHGTAGLARALGRFVPAGGRVR